jgi:hypothetical protein
MVVCSEQNGACEEELFAFRPVGFDHTLALLRADVHICNQSASVRVALQLHFIEPKSSHNFVLLVCHVD